MKIYVLMYQENEVVCSFKTMKKLREYVKRNNIPKEYFEEEFSIIKTDLIID